MALYDRIGTGYTAHRRPDPRIAARIDAALGDARTVLNVGAGTGSYEPAGRDVTAVEPSEVMIVQRPPGAAPVVRAEAQALPFADGAFDATMAVLSDHHWEDRAAGLRELRRVAARRAVVVTFDPSRAGALWFIADHLPAFGTLPSMAIDEVVEHLGATRVETVPVPHDCIDGFLLAYWRRPEALLDPTVRAAISVFRLLPAHETDAFLTALRADLDSGAWRERHPGIEDLEDYDVGLRIVVAERCLRAGP